MSAESRLRNLTGVDGDDIDRWESRGQGYKDRILSELKSLVSDAERLFRNAADTSSDGLASVRSQLDRRLEQTRDQVDRARRIVNQNAQRSTAAARGYVRENPLRSVGVATAAGVLVGLLVVTFLNSRR